MLGSTGAEHASGLMQRAVVELVLSELVTGGNREKRTEQNKDARHACSKKITDQTLTERNNTKYNPGK